MVKDKICEINVEKLMGEYHTLNNEILVKSSYLAGVKRRIAEEVEEYFNDYEGKTYRMKFDDNTCDDATVRIGNIKAGFCCDSLQITFYLVVNPDDLNKDIIWTEKEKKLRSKRLLELSDEKTISFYEQYIGQEAEVLFEKATRGRAMHGFTKNYIRVELSPADAKPEFDNELIRVRMGDFNHDKTALKATIING